MLRSILSVVVFSYALFFSMLAVDFGLAITLKVYTGTLIRGEQQSVDMK